MFGFYRIAAVTPRTVVADVSANLREHLTAYRTAVENGASLVVFPELSLTGATCGDLFRQDVLLDAALQAARKLAAATGAVPALFGLPAVRGNSLCDAMALASNGELLALIVKRGGDGIFSSASEEAFLAASELPPADGCGAFDGGLRFAVTVGSDIRRCDAVGEALRSGADVLIDPIAEPMVPGRDCAAEAAALSERFGGVCVTVAAGTGESTTDAVFAGNSRIGDRGRCVAQAEPFKRGTGILYYDIDTGAIRFRRRSDRRFGGIAVDEPVSEIPAIPEAPDFRYAHNPAAPFLPENADERARFCSDVLDIQAAGLAKRVEHTRSKTMVLGISGGLDSTLALVAAVRCRELLGLPREAVRAFTLPGFGTTAQTHSNAEELCRALDVELKEINITAACRQHFSDLGHDGSADAAFENAQARERTQILMDAANMLGGILIGTGDLSEIALGWCTYNGDQMSMYSVNGSVPKTLIPVLLEYEARSRNVPAFTEVVRDIIGTPISPELLPLGEGGALAQKTEDLVGPYELHDFFLYHLLDSGAGPEKIACLAEAAFAGRYTREVIEKWLRNFGSRFITQQFKRSAMPDGAAAGIFSLSPRGAWNMPSDASSALWAKW